MSDPLERTLADVANFLAGENIPFAVIGGVAASVRGEPRFTADIDIVMGIELESALSLIDKIQKTPFRTLFPDAAEVVKTSFILPLRHMDTRIKVDLAIGLSGFERQLIARATNTGLGGLSVLVATAEDLILLKLIAGRPRDLEDVRKIVIRQAGSLDWAYLLKTGGELQEALSQDLLSSIKKLQSRKSGEADQEI